MKKEEKVDFTAFEDPGLLNANQIGRMLFYKCFNFARISLSLKRNMLTGLNQVAYSQKNGVCVPRHEFQRLYFPKEFPLLLFRLKEIDDGHDVNFLKSCAMSNQRDKNMQISNQDPI